MPSGTPNASAMATETTINATVINAGSHRPRPPITKAAATAVDAARTPDTRSAMTKINAKTPGQVRKCRKLRFHCTRLCSHREMGSKNHRKSQLSSRLRMSHCSTLSIHGPIRKFHHEGIGFPHTSASAAPNTATVIAGTTRRLRPVSHWTPSFGRARAARSGDRPNRRSAPRRRAPRRADRSRRRPAAARSTSAVTATVPVVASAASGASMMPPAVSTWPRERHERSHARNHRPDWQPLLPARRPGRSARRA